LRTHSEQLTDFVSCRVGAARDAGALRQRNRVRLERRAVNLDYRAAIVGAPLKVDETGEVRHPSDDDLPIIGVGDVAVCG